MAKDGYPLGATVGAVLRAIFVTIRAGLAFGESCVPCFEGEAAFLPCGVRPNGLAPPAPRTRKESWCSARVREFIDIGKAEMAAIEEHAARIRNRRRIAVFIGCLVGAIRVVARSGDIAAVAFLIAHIDDDGGAVHGKH